MELAADPAAIPPRSRRDLAEMCGPLSVLPFRYTSSELAELMEQWSFIVWLVMAAGGS